MKLLFGIFSLLIVTIGVRGATKIEIYEIRDSDNGLQLKNMNSNPKINQKPNPILQSRRASSPKKTGKKVLNYAKKLLSKLKFFRGQKKTKRYNDDSYIYILNSDDFDDSSSREETLFIDKTRNERATVGNDNNDIRELLLKLLQTERITPLLGKRQLGQKQVKMLKKPVLRVAAIDASSLPHNQRDRHAYDYDDDDDDNGRNNDDRDVQ